MEIDNRPAWLSRAMNRKTPTKNRATVRTRSEYDTDLGGEVIFPTLRMGKDGKLRKSDIDEALDKNDYILIKGPDSEETRKKANAKSKQISKQIGIARQMKVGGALMKTEPAGLGVSPMTQKTSPPVGNKQVQTQKLPRARAAKVPDPRDEALKLVSERLKQDKAKGIATPMSVINTETATPMTTALAAMPMDEQPTAMKAGGTKSKKNGKGLAVVIDVSGPSQPKYEEASKGTPADPPPGATSDEVKDDQHVLLSEGELVVPANVVRYHGLGMYENLRREALQGLGEMEAAGQVDYIDDDVKSAQAGMTILDAPNVATPQGIARQQQAYNPALGQFGTATVPQAASAKFIRPAGFVDANRDGIDDKLQPSINKGIVAPVTTGAISPAALTLGPVTNPNVVVGAGNVGSYKQEQTYKPGDSTPSPADDTTPPPVAPTKVVQEQGGDSPVESEQEKAARELANQKIQRAKELGYEYNPIKQIATALLPLGFLGVGETPGTVTLAGNIVGNDGREYDPITGKVASSGSMFTDIANKMQGKDISNIGPGGAIIPETKDPIGLTPMTAAGLKQYTIDEMKKAIGEEQLVKQVNAEVDKLVNTSTVAPQVSNLKVNSFEELMQKIAGGEVGVDTNFAARRDGASAGPLAPEITGTGNMLTAEARANMEADPNYQSSRKSFAGLTENALNQILDDTIPSTVAQKAAAQDLKEELLLDRISKGTDSTGDAGRQAERESGFDVEETFGSGRKSQRDSALDTFNEDAKSDIESRGGTKSIGLNNNGSFYSENNDGSFTHEDGTTVNFTDSEGKPGNAPQNTDREQRMAERTAQYDDPSQAEEESAGTDSKIVCTEMYRQTQLDDWAQAMKTWYIYQKKYLTPLHEIGYHSLFRPFVRGMKVNNTLTSIGAYFAKERTKHLRHILTKGKAKDSMVGNIFCKIIHPIVYLVGLAVHKK